MHEKILGRFYSQTSFAKRFSLGKREDCTRLHSSVAVIPNRFHRTFIHGLLAERDFLGGGGLLADEGISLRGVAVEKIGGGLAAEVAIDALRIGVEFAGDVIGVFVCDTGHDLKSPFFSCW